MPRLATLLLSLLSYTLAVDYMFTDVAVYGLDRCISNGVGPCTDLLSVASPYRQSALDDRELASASVRINDRNELVVDTKNGGVVGHIRRGELRYPDHLKNKEKRLKGTSTRSYVVDDARTDDLVVIYVPHSTRLEITKARFYKSFNGREMDTVQLADDFAQRFIQPESTSRRFTLIVARVKRFDAALSRRFTVVTGPAAQNASNNDDEPLSFLASQPSIFQPAQQAQQPIGGLAPTSLPAQQSSQGQRIPRNTGHTQVFSNGPSSYQTTTQGSMSFAPRNTNHY